MIKYFKKKIFVLRTHIWDIREYIEFARNLHIDFHPFQIKLKIRFLNLGLDILLLESDI